jgi:ribosomal protein S18 acetylase RimI-like enzyme
VLLAVRNAVQDDAGVIAVIHVAASRAAYRNILSPGYFDGFTVEKRTAVWKGLIAGADAVEQIIIGAEGDAVRGFVHVGRSREPEPTGTAAEVYALYVDPPYWRHGVGRRLLAEGLTRFAQAGFELATLRVLAANGQARGFYEKHGWKVDMSPSGNRPSTVRYRISLTIPP